MLHCRPRIRIIRKSPILRPEGRLDTGCTCRLCALIRHKPPLHRRACHSRPPVPTTLYGYRIPQPIQRQPHTGTPNVIYICINPFALSLGIGLPGHKRNNSRCTRVLLVNGCPATRRKDASKLTMTSLFRIVSDSFLSINDVQVCFFFFNGNTSLPWSGSLGIVEPPRLACLTVSIDVDVDFLLFSATTVNTETNGATQQ